VVAVAVAVELSFLLLELLRLARQVLSYPVLQVNRSDKIFCIQ